MAVIAISTAVTFGIIFGNWLADRSKSSTDLQRMDEYLGLGERTGIAGDVALQVDPGSLDIHPGQPAKVKLTLKNEGLSTAYLNGWLAPTPANLDSNQFPVKVKITKDKHKVLYRGSFSLPPFHMKKDFFALDPGKSKDISVDLAASPGNGRWEMSSPGTYEVEVWYETYLTGKYIGMKAWTGTTNHVIVRVRVASEGIRN